MAEADAGALVHAQQHSATAPRASPNRGGGAPTLAPLHRSTYTTYTRRAASPPRAAAALAAAAGRMRGVAACRAAVQLRYRDDGN
eukprot:83312-Chlamydomonas_euryale.AAC.9